MHCTYQTPRIIGHSALTSAWFAYASFVMCDLLAVDPQTRIQYTAVGDGSALAFFSINSQTGGIFVKNSLLQDSLVSYTVS